MRAWIALRALPLRALDPVADAYLERAIPDFPPSGVPIGASWPQLQSALEALRDADALVSLGTAFQELTLGLDPTAPHDLRPNKARAVACARAALTLYPPASRDWAATQNNLAVTLSDQAGLAEGQARAGLLAEAVAAYRAALTVSTREAAPADWAMTQGNIALLYADMAADATTPAERLRLLRDALAAAQGARDVFAGTNRAWLQQATQICAAIESAISEEAGG